MSNPTPTGDQIAKLINDTVDDLESCWKENDQLRAALAAERERHEAQLADNDQKWKEKVELLQAQLKDNDEGWQAKLAAEREARQLAEHNLTRWQQAAMRDAAQLASAVEALREIDEAIPRVAKLPLVVEIKEIATAALAKIGEK